jgi:predicted esterase
MSLVHNVVGPPNAQRVLLLAHGYGADERDLGGLLPYLDPEGRFLTVLPRGPVAAPPGFAWYDAGSIVGNSPAGRPFLDSLDGLDALLDEVCTEHGLDRAEAVVGGFSQGGALAVALGLRRDERPHPAGVIALSSYLPDVEGVDYDW